MTHSRPMLPKEYRASDLRDELDVSSVPDDERTMHTLFAVLVNDIDRRADIHQSIKPEIMEGLAQAWLYFLEEETGVDVAVEQHQHGIETGIDDPADERRAAANHQHGLPSESSVFDLSLRETPDRGRVPLGEFERDMRRLDDLRRDYASPGLNTFEQNESRELREKYGLSHREWWQREYLESKPDADENQTVNMSSP